MRTWNSPCSTFVRGYCWQKMWYGLLSWGIVRREFLVHIFDFTWFFAGSLLISRLWSERPLSANVPLRYCAKTDIVRCAVGDNKTPNRGRQTCSSSHAFVGRHPLVRSKYNTAWCFYRCSGLCPDRWYAYHESSLQMRGVRESLVISWSPTFNDISSTTERRVKLFACVSRLPQMSIKYVRRSICVWESQRLLAAWLDFRWLYDSGFSSWGFERAWRVDENTEGGILLDRARNSFAVRGRSPPMDVNGQWFASAISLEKQGPSMHHAPSIGKSRDNMYAADHQMFAQSRQTCQYSAVATLWFWKLIFISLYGQVKIDFRFNS